MELDHFTNEILKMYDDGQSTYEIAKVYNTYPLKVTRLIKKHRNLRTRSEAQKLALETGRHEHPTKGKKRTEEEKVKISESTYKYWQEISTDERDKRVEKAKELWNNMTDDERETLRAAAVEGVQKAAKQGSTMERFLLEELQKLGYDVLFHKTRLIESDALELDLFIPSLNTAIEIDGPAHFFPIWGQDSLNKHVKADAKKTGLLLSHDMVIIRVKHLIRKLSAKHKRDVLRELVAILEKIKDKFPDKNDRYIELDVK